MYDCSIDELISDLQGKLPANGEFIFSGGEATIAISGSYGMGGRNTHFVLSFAEQIYKISENQNIHILSIGTDGGDGPTDAAGAYLNFDLFKTKDARPYLKNFDSYNYFKELGSLICTGPTKSNVMDLRVIWRE